MNSKIIGPAAAIPVTFDFQQKQLFAAPGGVSFQAGVPQRFDFIAAAAPNNGIKVQLPDNPLTVGKSTTLSVDFYEEDDEAPVVPTQSVSLHEGAHGGHVDCPTEPGKQGCFVITASHDIGCAVGVAALKPLPPRAPRR